MAEAPNIYTKQYLLTAGPTPLPPAVSQVMAEPILYHRAPAFIEVYARVLARPAARVPDLQRGPVLRRVRHRRHGVRGREPGRARRAGGGRLVRQVRRALGRAVRRLRRRTVHLEFEWGEQVDPARLDEALARLDRPARAVFTTQSETSTGVLNDIRALNEVAVGRGSVLCVDAVSGLGAVDLPQDEWGVDVVVAGSQKSLMSPAGPRLRLGLRPGPGPGRRDPGPPLLPRLGANRARDSGSSLRTRRSRPR